VQSAEFLKRDTSGTRQSSSQPWSRSAQHLEVRIGSTLLQRHGRVKSLTYRVAAHPNLNLTAEEKRVYGNLLKEADPDGFGAVSGDVAVKFFERTRLPPDVLGQVSHATGEGFCGDTERRNSRENMS